MSAHFEPGHAAVGCRSRFRLSGRTRPEKGAKRSRGYRLRHWIAGLCCAVLWSGAALADSVTVFAAASLKTALDEVALNWRDAGHQITVSYAGSSALARQIELGAPADIFISASTEWMDHLESKELIEPGQRLDLLENTLVLIAHGKGDPVVIGPDLPLTQMLGDGRLAMALVNAVPAGQYGKAALQALRLWDAVAPQVAQADNVRAALALVALGEAPLGIVYATDARAEPRVSVLGVFPPDSHPRIVYPAAVIRGHQRAEVQALFSYLSSPAARSVFAGQGFLLPGS